MTVYGVLVLMTLTAALVWSVVALVLHVMHPLPATPPRRPRSREREE